MQILRPHGPRVIDKSACADVKYRRIQILYWKRVSCMSYVKEVLEQLIAKNPGEALFHQAATEVLSTIAPVIEANPASA